MIVPSAEQIKQIEDAREACLEEDRTFAQTYTVAHPTRIALRAGYFACHLALTLLDTLSQEVERLKEENTKLLTRRDSAGDSPRQPAAPTDTAVSHPCRRCKEPTGWPYPSLLCMACDRELQGLSR